MDVISLALATYILVMAITPGPNNVLLAASGVNYGLRRTLPMMLGIALGGGFHCFVSMLMFGHLFELMAVIRLPIAVAGCLYLLWLAWHIYRASAPETGEQSRPLTFMQMVLFQWVNPKAWVMMLNMAALFMPAAGPVMPAAALIGITDTLVSLPCVLLWAWLGDRLRLALQSPRHLQLFNTLMGVSLAITAAWLLLDELRLLLAV
ncbi:LysE family translocator [Thiopseudomonas denitrificans]|uniref:Threonine/homoserine/homoserine lactone efflux protein n=1 Tax=Thiopseudomonas denitrificans TaxID=1501432 RepID=A0A4R6TX84_9GAMM|nr:LysE family translocator [Thiopseudomonas denitrificans]TDQ38488.1 threonine/homoserine/homoserine lactone efflux protein [Thiopseudomonas denitrificans]